MASLWDFYTRPQDGKLASIFLDLGFSSEAPVTGKSTLAVLSLTMLSPRPDGLSSTQEYEALRNLEDRIESAVLDEAAIFVGRITTNGTRQFFYYLADPVAFETKLHSSMPKFGEYKYALSLRHDPKWQAYREFLYPDAATLREMALRREEDRQHDLNSKVIDTLTGNGDDIDAARNIDHWAYFASENDRLRYVDKIAEQGYRVTRLHARDPQSQLQYCVQFARVDSPSNIDEVTIWLAHEAMELGGEYDGWECAVTE